MTEPNEAEALDETAWLIEHGASEPCAPRYWGGVHGWTYDHAKAVRFSREVDAQSQAEAMDDGFPNNYRLAEHAWVAHLVREDVRPEPYTTQVQKSSGEPPCEKPGEGSQIMYHMPDGPPVTIDGLETGNTEATTPPEPAQEPVAWMYEDDFGRSDITMERHMYRVIGWTETPLYAQPLNLPNLLRTPETIAEIKRQGWVEAGVVDTLETALNRHQHYASFLDGRVVSKFGPPKDTDFDYGKSALAKLKEARNDQG